MLSIQQFNQFPKKTINSNSFYYLIILLFLQFHLITLKHFDSFKISDLKEKSTLVDFADYSNSYIFITTSQKIYTGINPELKTNTTAKLNKFTFGVSYDENYILLACLNDSLLSKVNINTGETISLLSYEKINGNLKLPKYPCSLSFYDNFTYIAFSFGYDIEDPFDYIYKEEQEEEQEIEIEEYKEEYEYEEKGEEGEFVGEEEFLEKEEKTEEVEIEENEEMEIKGELEEQQQFEEKEEKTEEIEIEEKKEMEEKMEFKEEQQLEEKEEIIEEVEIEEKEEEFVKNETKNNKTEEVDSAKILRNLDDEEVVENYIKNYAIKIKLNDTENDGPVVDENYKILFHHFDYELNIKDITVTQKFRHVSCEVINPTNINDPRLVCGYITFYNSTLYNTTTNGKPFLIKLVVFNTDFNGFEETAGISSRVSNSTDFKLQKIDPYNLRYTITGTSSIVYLNGTYSLLINAGANKIGSFNSFESLFFYNNGHIFSFDSGYYLYIYKNVGPHYLRYQGPGKMEKVIGYFNETNDKYLVIYQTDETIKYFQLENLTLLFGLNVNKKTAYLNSSSTNYTINIRELIQNEYLYDEMVLLSKILYISQYLKVDTFNGSYDFNQTAQILTIYQSDNNWYSFTFAFLEYLQRDDVTYQFYFIPKDCTYRINTCQFKCGSCNEEGYDKCDVGVCKDNFTTLRDSNDTDCYPNDQNFFNYIYNRTTNHYEKCYETCRFCSLMGNLSSFTSQNCKNCNDGYLRSYEYKGNCYKIDNSTINNNTVKKKIVNKIDDENFTIVDSCLETNKTLTIKITGECVSKCPRYSNYYYYYFNSSVNFSSTSENPLDERYSLYSESEPKYLFNNQCLTYCPSFSEANTNTYECECTYGWHRNSTTKEITCYGQNYCKYDYYRYYLNDNRECIHEMCPSNYYTFYFQCYLNSCPNDTIPSTNNKSICESKYSYCYIDENYQNHCQNSKSSIYKYQYNYTKLYFKSCNTSLFLFDVKTYLYSNICLTDCPEQTEIDSTNNSCICKYYIYYLDTNREYYTCLLQNETCENRNLFPVIEMNECLTTLNDCKRKGYKIFNKQCFLNCPNNTKLSEDGYNCICPYHYFTNASDLLNCLDSNITCEEKGFFVNNLDNGHCLNSTNDCIKKGYKIFNGQCYINCPNNTKLKDDNYTCFCSYHYSVDSNNMFICFNSDKTCEDEGYPVTNLDNKECLNSTNDCINKAYPIFNNNCYINCPINTKLNSSIHSCVCSYYYHIENNTYSCFDKDKTCKDKDFQVVNVENKECLSSINDCILKDYKIFNNECYFNCPVNTHLVNSNFCFCSFNYFNNSDNNSTCFSQDQNCKSQGHLITNIDNKQCLDSLDECIANNYFIFNNNCYLECPKLTRIDKNEKNYCTCKYSSEKNKVTNEIKCANYPDEYYINPGACLAIYNGKCYKECPEGTCFSSDDYDLIDCVDIESGVKVASGICFEEYSEIIDIVKNMSENVQIIKRNCGANISIYYVDSTIEEVLSKNQYATFVNLGECGDLLKKFYGLPSETELRIVVIDCPTKKNNISVCDFSYEVYLGNGTQLKNLSICQKITTSSFITDPERVRLKIAESFSTQGYDIYNLSDSFYTSNCAPAVNSEGNDITLKDRMKDIYLHNISLCITGCEYNKVDFNAQRFICVCDAELGESYYEIKLLSNSTEEEISYLEYFLSLINYKIITCSELLLTNNNYYYNIGFYIGVSISVVCFVEIFLFYICGIRKIKIIFLDNFPNKYKLQELAKEQEEIRLKNLKKEKEEENKLMRNSFRSRQLSQRNIIRKKNRSMTRISIIKSDINLNSNPPKIKRINIINKNNDSDSENKENINYYRKRTKRTKSTQINNLEKFKNSSDDLQSVNYDEKRKEAKKNLKQYLKNQHINNKKKLQNKFKSRKNIESKMPMCEIPLKESIHHQMENDILKKCSSKICLYNNQENNLCQSFHLKDAPIRKDRHHRTTRKGQSLKVIRNIIDNYEKNNDLNQKNAENERELHFINHRKSIIEIKEELIIDKEFRRLILIDDDNIEEDDLNDIPYSQAIRLDRRNFFKIFLSFFTKEVDLLEIISHFHPFSHFSLLTSVYFTELLLDLALNCFLYTDDVVSEKYHNNGELKYFTTLYLSFLSNMFSSIIMFIVQKLTVYEEFLESIIKEVKVKDAYLINMQRFLNYVKIRIGFFYLIQLIMNCAETYYLFIFCSVYHKSQSSIMINYVVGIIESFAISFGISFINTILRIISLRNKSNNLYNISKFIADKF